MSHTPGPWDVKYYDNNGQAVVSAEHIEIATCWHHCVVSIEKEMHANASLIAAAPDQHAEMVRYLPVLERAESDPALWELLTQGLGIATLNGYRAAIAKAANA